MPTKNTPLDRLAPGQPFAEHEQHFKYKIVFLNGMFLLSASMALGIGVYRWRANPVLGAMELGFAAVACVLMYYLKRHREQVESIAMIALVLSFAMCCAIYALAPYQATRLSLFFPLAAAAFFLKGLRGGLLWLLVIVVGIVAVHLMPGVETGFSALDIATTCLYLAVLFFILWNYETLKEDQYRREREHGLQSLIDERWRLALEGAGDAIWDWDIQAGTFNYSKSYGAMLGYQEGEISRNPDHLKNLLHPEDEPAASAHLEAYLDGEFGGHYVSEQRMRCADGAYKWILCRGQITERDGSGRPRRMVGTHADITERKQIEATLRESEKRLHLALDSARMGVWDFDVVNARLYWSPEVYRLFGLEYFEPTIEDFRKLVHADDRAQVQVDMDKAIGEHVPYFAEFRIGEADALQWVEDHGEVQYDESGKPLRVIGIVQNITERKRTSEEILRSRQTLDEERGLFQTILDNAPLGIWMVDAKGKVQFVNQAFCNATGIPEARFLAADHYADVLPPSVTASCKKSDRECMEQQAPHLSLETLPFADGREHLLEITKVRLLGKDGAVKGNIGLAVDVTERAEQEKQLERMAHYDALTGVPNRVLLADRLAQALARTKRERGLMAVCYLDLDGFKPVNDSFGHGPGDRVLCEITRRIKEAVREDDTVARLGGDEFVVLLVGLQVPEECVGSLQRLLESIKQPIAINDAVLSISASIGVALYPEDDQDADTLLRHADQAMYLAKQAGKNRYHLFDVASDLRARSHHELLQQIRHGLAHGEFELHYQPKVEMRTRRLVGAEALIRWNHPRRGRLLPAEFLRTVENTDLEIDLGDWVVGTAVEQLRSWRQEGFEIDLSINISANHLQSAGFVRKLKESASRRGALDCLRRLQIEVLETAALEDIGMIGALIGACRELGVGFALDDFGTGYASLTYLSKLDVDTLKIDQSFVRDMQDDRGDHAVVQGIIALARAFDMKIVAEGVETEAHYQALLRMGCEVGQGHGIARPMPAAELAVWRAAGPA